MPELSDLAIEFIEYESKQNASLNTLRAYQNDLEQISEQFETLTQLNNPNNLRSVRLKWLEQYSDRTIARKWSALREFLSFCVGKGLLAENKILQIKVETANKERTLRKNIPDQETIKAICEAPESLRDRAILHFLYSTGMRLSEYVQWGQLKNLNLAAGEFTLPDRVCYLNDMAKHYLREYLSDKKRSNWVGLDGPIFTGKEGKPLSESLLYGLVRKSAMKLGLKAKLQDFRDSLALTLLEQGVGPEELMHMMGYKSKKSLEPFLS